MTLGLATVPGTPPHVQVNMGELDGGLGPTEDTIDRARSPLREETFGNQSPVKGLLSRT